MTNKSDQKIILFRKLHSQFEAELVRNKLETHGIPAMVMSDDAGGMEPQFQWVRGVRVMIRERDREAAEQVMETNQADIPGE